MADTKKETKKTNLGVPLFNISGDEKNTLDLPGGIFKVEVNHALIAQSVRVYMANQRSGNASTKTRSEVTGSTRKIYRQKGTGKARHGDIKAPIFVGGGVAGGPKPKNHSLDMNSGMKKIALFGALSMKLKDKEIIGLDEVGLDKVEKTKQIHQFLKKIEMVGKKTLFVLSKIEDSSFLKSMRNIKSIKFIDASSLNPYIVLNSKKLIITKGAVESLSKHFLKA